jgi:hypothetical protein
MCKLFSEPSRSWIEPGGQFDLATRFRSHPAEDLWWPVVLDPVLFRQPICRPSRGPSATRQSVPGTGIPYLFQRALSSLGRRLFTRKGSVFAAQHYWDLKVGWFPYWRHFEFPRNLAMECGSRCRVLSSAPPVTGRQFSKDGPSRKARRYRLRSRDLGSSRKSA